MIRRMLPLASLALLTAMFFMTPNSARAGDHHACYTPHYTPYCTPKPYCAYKTVVCYEKVTKYETRQEPYTCKVKCYDECGRCYYKERTCYREVQVPVTCVVPVTKRVPVCD